MKKLFFCLSVLLLATPSFAEDFTIDPRHTFPSFEVSHMGLSTQRGRFNSTSGKITLDRVAKTGSIELEIDATTVNTGLAELEKHMRAEDFFNVEKFPKITFKSTSVAFEGEDPRSVEGAITLLGVTRPLTLSISSFNCRVHPMTKKYVCGADASATLKRSEFGMIYAIPAVSDEVRLVIQVEAIREDGAALKQ
ncbi:MAG: polyisoprenoid-binding protein [Deltaproteobacteria bacterium]|nr:polyisoprenoid-binding protein [Deltaproteobacteria bacterium]